MSSRRRTWTIVGASTAVASMAMLWLFSAPRPSGERVAQPKIPRGVILDRHGDLLAGGATVWQVSLDLQALRRMPAEQATEFLTQLGRRLGLGIDLMPLVRDRRAVTIDLPARLDDSARRRLSRWLQESEWKDRSLLIRFSPKEERIYPWSMVFAPLLGFVDPDSSGLEGVELQLDERLDRGEAVRLSIETQVQLGLTDILGRALQASHAAEASAMAIEIPTGRIAALVSLPSFDPNDRSNRLGSQVRLRPVIHTFQAGPMLQPFLAYACLTDPHLHAQCWLNEFENLAADAGSTLATSLGYDAAMSGLGRSGLLSGRRLEFPGVQVTLVRSSGTTDDKLRDLGNGAGIAPSVFNYAAAFADTLAGTGYRPTTLLASDVPTTSPAPAAGAARILREALVNRARRQSGNAMANFGGLWAIYPERGRTIPSENRIAALALFTPADEPTYLLVIMLRVRSGELTELGLLDIGTRALSRIVATRNCPRRPGPCRSSPG